MGHGEWRRAAGEAAREAAENRAPTGAVSRERTVQGTEFGAGGFGRLPSLGLNYRHLNDAQTRGIGPPRARRVPIEFFRERRRGPSPPAASPEWRNRPGRPALGEARGRIGRACPRGGRGGPLPAIAGYPLFRLELDRGVHGWATYPEPEVPFGIVRLRGAVRSSGALGLTRPKRSWSVRVGRPPPEEDRSALGSTGRGVGRTCGSRDYRVQRMRVSIPGRSGSPSRH